MAPAHEQEAVGLVQVKPGSAVFKQLVPAARVEEQVPTSTAFPLRTCASHVGFGVHAP
jgi:hypothetical protein